MDYKGKIALWVGGDFHAENATAVDPNIVYSFTAYCLVNGNTLCTYLHQDIRPRFNDTSHQINDDFSMCEEATVDVGSHTIELIIYNGKSYSDGFLAFRNRYIRALGGSYFE